MWNRGIAGIHLVNIKPDPERFAAIQLQDTAIVFISVLAWAIPVRLWIEAISAGVRVGIGVGGGEVAVSVGSGVGGNGDSVGVGLSTGGGRVKVGNPIGGVGWVGLNTAVMVKSGVGKTIGVGAETNGKLQARTSSTACERPVMLEKTSVIFPSGIVTVEPVT